MFQGFIFALKRWSDGLQKILFRDCGLDYAEQSSGDAIRHGQSGVLAMGNGLACGDL